MWQHAYHLCIGLLHKKYVMHVLTSASCLNFFQIVNVVKLNHVKKNPYDDAEKINHQMSKACRISTGCTICISQK